MTPPTPAKAPAHLHNGYLTLREREIAVQLRADGFSRVSIALRMGVSASCISRHTRGVVKPKGRGW